MEFFNKAKAVRLRSHLDKYLIAYEDEETVLQSRNGSTRKARWDVELVEGKSHVIRLKGCHGRYLAASDEPFLLGMTGKKVVQDFPATKRDISIEWEPIREGFHVKLRAKLSGRFLRANWGTPPWRNSVTHDVPHRTATQDWVLWEVDIIDICLSESESLESFRSPASTFSSLAGEVTCPTSRSSSIASDFRSGHSSFSTSAEVTGSNALSSSISSDYKTGHSSFSSSQNDFRGSNGRSLSIVSKPGQACGNQSGMQFFDGAKAVRLESYVGKYLVADEDEETVRQSRNGSSNKARWTVEFVEGKSHLIRLKSCHGLYLTATDEPFLLGMTGKKVLQTSPATKADSSIEWEPIQEGFQIKLRTREGKFLRANGGTPPWRNSITHDVPQRTVTQDWVLWGVDIVDIRLSTDSDSLSRNTPTASSCFSSVDDFAGSPDTGSPAAGRSWRHDSAKQSIGSQTGMEFFQKSRTVRHKSNHDKYLLAEEDQESVCQDRNGSTDRARWTVEFVDGIESVVRLKSCYGKYLTATDEHFLLGLTGRKVTQSLPRKLDSKVEWEPLRDGFQVRFKTRYGNYLRANGGLPPWRNSVTHDIPHRLMDWILWEVEVVERRSENESPSKQTQMLPNRSDSLPSSEPSSPFCHLRSPMSSKLESNESLSGSLKSDGRIIYYSVVDKYGEVEEGKEESSFHFGGHELEELTEKLKEETGLQDVIVCLRNPLNGKLNPLRLDLPPNNANMHIVLVPSSAKGLLV